jgi:internalin A
LTSLSIDDNPIKILPPAVATLPSLRVLSLRRTRVGLIPAAVGYLSNLTSMSCDVGNIRQPPPHVMEQPLPLIQKYLCGYDQAARTGELNLSGCYYRAVPDDVAQGVVNVTSLDLSNNVIGQIPLPLCDRTDLTRLDLSGNHVTSVPPGVARLTALTWLSLARCSIVQLPRALRHLSNLTHLDISDNLIDEPPPVVWRRGKDVMFKCGPPPEVGLTLKKVHVGS